MHNDEAVWLDGMSRIIGALCVIIAKKCYDPFIIESPCDTEDYESHEH